MAWGFFFSFFSSGFSRSRSTKRSGISERSFSGGLGEKYMTSPNMRPRKVMNERMAMNG